MPPRTDRTLLALAPFAALLSIALSSSRAHAEGNYGKLDVAAADGAPHPTYFRAFFTSAAGVGFRFNNPYRLARQIGSSAESTSTTAPYLDLGLGVTFGDPFGLQHGAVLRYDHSLTGVTQHVLTPSYIALRRFTHFELFGRFGLPLLLSPDVNLGGELAVGGAWFFRAGIGVSAEVIGDLFFGAATPDQKRPIYPIVSGQLGVVVEWERL